VTAKPAKLIVMLSCDGFTRGGIGRWVSYVFAAWAEIADAPPLRMIDTRAPSGRVGPSIVAFARAMATLAWLCLSGRVGLVHANVADRGSTARKLIATAIAGLFGVKAVVHLHSGSYFDFYRGLSAVGRWAVRRMFNRAAKVIVLGKVWEDAVVAELEVPRANVVVLFNGAPSPAPGGPGRLAAAAECHIVMLARLGRPKGVDDLMIALGSDMLRTLPWRATLAGSGAPPYQAEAVARGLAERIVFPGWVGPDAAEALLRTADILVLPSHFECMPVSVIEAMAHGVAVVTTPVGAVPEIVADGVSGLLVPVRDPAALATALARLIAEPLLRKRLGAGGRAVFEASLDVRQSARRLAALYALIMT
jgi:glycosyltransferase involved in cell wall biosynthesis